MFRLSSWRLKSQIVDALDGIVAFGSFSAGEESRLKPLPQSFREAIENDGLWPSAAFPSAEGATASTAAPDKTSDLCLLSELQRVINLYAEIAHGAFEFRVSQQ